MLVSVVVPTYRRDELLRRCLAALLAQDFPAAEYEIIVVDDAASDATRRMVDQVTASAASQPEETARGFLPPTRSSGAAGEAEQGALPWWRAPIRREPPERRAGATGPGASHRYHQEQVPGDLPWLEGAWGPADAGPDDSTDVLLETHYVAAQPTTNPAGRFRQVPAVRYLAVTGKHGPAVARNLGWRAAGGEIVAFTDDDCLPAPSWLRAGLAAFGPQVQGVSGRIIMPLDGTPTDYELNATGLERSEFVTANCFYRRSALSAAGGFDEHFAGAWREDTDLYFRLLEQAGGSGSAPWSPRAVGPYRHAADAIVIHPVRPAPWGISLSQQRKNLDNALLYRKHPLLYRRRIQSAPPWSYYFSVAAIGAGLAGLAAGRPRLAAAGWALWLGLTGRFVFRRLHGTSHQPGHVAEMLATSALIPPLAVYWRLRGAFKHKVWFL